MPESISPVLLSGATGYVGNALYPALTRAGYGVRCLTRNVEKARRRWPEREWAEGDLGEESKLATALDGCSAAFYLVHSMGDPYPDYRQRERAAAERFAAVASRTGLQRVIYLGGVRSKGSPSEHLASRLEVGEALRGGTVPALELRAGLIVGAGSLSWTIVRDLAARLPVMVLPAWLKSRMQPVSIEDILVALTSAVSFPLRQSVWFDLPGPDTLTGEEILYLTAEAVGLKRPLTLSVPFLTPRLSSLWLRVVTRGEWSVSKELVLGLTSDLLAESEEYWRMIGHSNRLDFRTATHRALDDEVSGEIVGAGRWVESAVRKLHGRANPHSPAVR